MTIPLRQSTASQEIPLGYFVDSTDGDSAETGLTIANTDIKIWKNGATTLANKNSGGATHISGGIYYCVLDATDTNTLGGLVVFVHVSGALCFKQDCCVWVPQVYDSMFGTDKLDVAVVEQANIDFGALQKASINLEVDNALNTAIPGGPTANSMNERIVAIDDKIPTNYIMGSSVTSAKDDEIDAVKAKTDLITTAPATEATATIIKNVVKNRRKIVGNQLIIYASDDVTPLYVYDLKDSAGAPAMVDVYDADPV